MDAITKTFFSMFAQYDRVPAISPDWYKDLKNGIFPNTGNDTVNLSIAAAYNKYVS